MPKRLASLPEDALDHVARQFAHWRQRRATPRARIPGPLWDQAVALTHRVPLSRVAKRLGLCLTDLKKRSSGRPVAADARGAAAPLTFVEVTAPVPYRTPGIEVEVHRPDGARLRLIASEATPTLTALVQTFWEPH